ncbi:aminoglycoside phosphotransferase family protein [Azospirillum sp. YIM B02556]|uniref:Aminoglycoside phosphotransferase family protein n=1 Tax=Azospirillum endophyticum TaxID=2800326 RepID=A0ABS1FBH4_9PROT|nr:aminoglycoside phosphotransferase family protein [Azospirillum endophyticum]MBK1840776.1 aminoglycoside phosphotransferase family protein [Azospirillum endophyticum]
MSLPPCFPHHPGADPSGLAQIAARLASGPVLALRQAGNGGNSRLYRVETETGPCALKLYPPRGIGGPDRLGHERAALSFLHTHGAAVPRLLGSDPDADAALLEWIDGVRPTANVLGPPLTAMIAFLERLHGLRHASGAAELPQAVEACPSAAELLRQIEVRRPRLAQVAEAPGNGGLARLLGEALTPAFARLRTRLDTLYDRAGLAPDRTVPLHGLTLSPSDFGLHNALCRPDGTIVFLDFEYFGWDDPVKLVADTLWHPGMQLSGDGRGRFLTAAEAIYGTDPAFPVRLAAQVGFFGLRWCLIVLSDFLPERWAHRVHAGAGGSWEDAKRIQMAKAEALLDRVVHILDVDPMDWPAAFNSAGND